MRSQRVSVTWLVAIATGCASGAAAQIAGRDDIAAVCWTATTVAGLALALWSAIDAARRQRLGVDVIAVLALAGSLLIDEALAGALISLMLVTGRALEAWAAGRAEADLSALERRAPRIVHRRGTDDLTDVAIEIVHPGDVLLVRPGEVVPVDGVVADGRAVLDESALTGESLPVTYEHGSMVRSGVVNVGRAFDVAATTDVSRSTYATIVRMAENASASSSPLSRRADRLAAWFIGLTLVFTAATGALTGELERAVSVLVVATPCPLILAVPVAFVSGLSQCSRRGVVVKGGAALEALADATVVLLDKTGTLTTGHLDVVDIVTAAGHEEGDVLRRAAALEQASSHPLAAAIVRAAAQRGFDLTVPSQVQELAGVGIDGVVEGHRVSVGSSASVPGASTWSRDRAPLAEGTVVHVTIDGRAAGAIVLADRIRPDAPRSVRSLRRAGIRRVLMVTGDRLDVARSIGAIAGVDEVCARQSPADKLDVVRRESAAGPTVMVGDGINDAPALAAATVGVAFGGQGGTVSTEAADVVILADRLDRLAEARLIATRSRSIAQQAVVGGMTLSVVAMIAAATGHLPPAWGALAQELIDVAAILFALRALQRPRQQVRLDQRSEQIARGFQVDHATLQPALATLRTAADQLGRSPSTAMATVRRAHQLLTDEIVPHEQREDRELYPPIASAIGGADPTATMSRAHAEIMGMTDRLGAVLARIDGAEPSSDEVHELQRLLYGLHAILELHFAQENESYLSLADPAPFG